MTTIIRIDMVGYRHDFGESDLPLAIGVSSKGAVVFDVEAKSSPMAWFGSVGRQVFLQPVAGSASMRINKKLLKESVWLSANDKIEVNNTLFKVTIDADVIVLSPASRPKGPVLTPPPRTPSQDAISTPPEEALIDSKPPDVEQNPPQPKDTIPIPTEKTSNETESAEDNPPPPPRKKPTELSFSPLPVKKNLRRLRYLTIGVFTTLLLGVIFVLTAVPIQILIQPSPDTASLRGILPSVKVKDRYFALPGSYHIVAQKEGYHKLEASIQVKMGSDSTFAYALVKLPGLLDVTSRPVTGAQIQVDGSVVGTTPLASLELQPGSHELRIVAPRYLPKVQSFQIQGMGTRQQIDAVLQPGWGTLQVESKPDRAEVWLNGKIVGQTSLSIEPMAGNYELKLHKEGWKPISKNVKIEPGETVQVPPIELQRLDGVLELTSSPSGASVNLNGEFHGHTPMSLVVRSEHDHELRLTQSGFVAALQSVRVEGGDTQSIDIQLDPEYGTVFISCRPAAAELMVDGKTVGTPSRRLKLTTLPHQIEIRKAGYEPFITTLTPTVGVPKRLDVQLKTIREAQNDALPLKIKTVEGQVLCRIWLDEPVQFQMGASRREPGRRSNETQYTVELTRTFYISEKEVTNAEFKRFNQKHDSGSDNGFDLNEMDQPVASVRWNTAVAYLNWLSEKEGLPPAYEEIDGNFVAKLPFNTGYRLPTEAEWAFVSRFKGGARPDDKPFKYPWGNSREPSEKSGNYADSSAAGNLPLVIKGYTDGYGVAAPVGQFPPNAAGIYDLGGNVSEWCHDYFDVHLSGQTQVLQNPTGPVSGRHHVVRGASWRHGSITELRLSYRDYSDQSRHDLGFRIARYAE